MSPVNCHSIAPGQENTVSPYLGVMQPSLSNQNMSHAAPLAPNLLVAAMHASAGVNSPPDEAAFRFLSLPRELRDIVYEFSTTNGGSTRVLWKAGTGKREVQLVNLEDQTAIHTFHGLAMSNLQASEEASERYLAKTTPEFEEPGQFNVLFEQLGEERDGGKPKAYTRLSSIAFRSLAGPQAVKVFRNILDMPNIRRVVLVPRRRMWIDRLLSSPRVLNFLLKLKQKRAEDGRQTHLIFEANWFNAAHDYEANRRKCRMLAPAGRLDPDAVEDAVDALNDYWDTELANRLYDHITRLVHAKTDRIRDLRAGTSTPRIQAHIRRLRQQRRNLRDLRASNAYHADYDSPGVRDINLLGLDGGFDEAPNLEQERSRVHIRKPDAAKRPAPGFEEVLSLNFHHLPHEIKDSIHEIDATNDGIAKISWKDIIPLEGQLVQPITNTYRHFAR
ncbi:uncharacterized protein BDZ99DRAFT_565504 [Mytilinidion resinicola]|uniref:Uncharacterized protein n=1 Tax=Mytilinidion resinicola TaxID=574789 RepID=A0A6A6ZCF9_9PEZI|nr:uncharacterized protein BDZ99DRAFT_565504 [Mytilinidion resinicola]KAF2817887.1 hypothetical protein BDZ99DRAFT_565504 [Mytilinidion resinicola]